MNEQILKAVETALDAKIVTREDLNQCQKAADSKEDMFYVFWLMARYYDLKGREDASVYCALKAKDFHDKKMQLDLRISQFISDKTDFMNEKYKTMNNRIYSISITLGVFTLITMWFFLHQSFGTAFIFMNIFSLGFYSMARKRTNEKFKARQLAACYDFLDKEDQTFADGI